MSHSALYLLAVLHQDRVLKATWALDTRTAFAFILNAGYYRTNSNRDNMKEFEAVIKTFLTCLGYYMP